tara:strand:- start:403 stop:585 length:183 start_codon:yes stop_codon:yes gene_type:complete
MIIETYTSEVEPIDLAKFINKPTKQESKHTNDLAQEETSTGTPNALDFYDSESMSRKLGM